MRRHRTRQPRHCAAVRGPAAWAARLLLAACLLLPTLQAQSQSAAPAAPAAPFAMGTDLEAASLGGRWIRRIYTEAFRRMGMRVEVHVSPVKRVSLLMDQGELDGDMLRVHGYAANHPDQVRVEESTLDVVFSLYTANPALRLGRIEELAATKLLGEYRRGVEICAATMRRWLPADRLSEVTATDQALHKLLAGRTDVYCENDLGVDTALLAPEFKDKGAAVRPLLDLGRQPLHPYLHKKHAGLADQLAATLKQMKAEGLIQAYRAEAERELRR